MKHLILVFLISILIGLTSYYTKEKDFLYDISGKIFPWLLTLMTLSYNVFLSAFKSFLSNNKEYLRYIEKDPRISDKELKDTKVGINESNRDFLKKIKDDFLIEIGSFSILFILLIINGYFCQCTNCYCFQIYRLLIDIVVSFSIIFYLWTIHESVSYLFDEIAHGSNFGK